MFENIRNWKRRDFPTIDGNWMKRKVAEEETDRDLQKPVQQLLCDAHEEALDPIDPSNLPLATAQLMKNLVGVNKRMTSLMVVSAYENTKMTRWVIALTWVIVLQTCILIYLAFFPRPMAASPSSPASPPAVVNTVDKK